MPILDTEIKLMESERMYDADDGGGRMSGSEIVGGVSNNMFPDISQLDRTYGRLNLRKAFEAVLSNNTDTFFGSNVIVSKPPSDDTVHVTLFKTSSDDSAWVDERTDAQDKMESYITVGQISKMRMIGTHYEGQRAVLVYQKTTDQDPAVGDVYALVDDTNSHTQFVRVTAVDVVESVYTDADGDFTRNEITLTISDPLEHQFEGGTVLRETATQPETEFHKTNAIPAVSYFGIQTLAAEAAFDDREVKVASYKGYLLPATQSEEALTDVPLSNDTSFTGVVAGTRTVEVNQVQESSSFEIDINNRGYTYVHSLTDPKPKAGTVSIAYRAQEKWYTLTDENEDGQLVGDGSGSVNYSTGSVSITLDEMPDVGTRIIFGWGSGEYLERADSNPAPANPEYRFTVANYPIETSSITITWNSGAKTASDNGTGLITGDATGTVDYATGLVIFSPTDLVDPASIPQIQYTKRAKVTETFNNVLPDSGTGLATLTLANQPEPNSIKVSYATSRWKYCGWHSYGRGYSCYFSEGVNKSNSELVAPNKIHITTSDDGVNKLNVGNDSAVDYAAKTVTIDAAFSYEYKIRWWEKWFNGTWYTNIPHYEDGNSTTVPISTTVTIEYCVSGASTQVYNESIPAQELKFDLTTDTMKCVYPNSLAFSMAGHIYWDYEGIIYRDGNYVVADGTESGTIDYTTGIVTLTDWVSGSPAISLNSLLLENNPWVAVTFTAYTSVAPIKSSSLNIAVTATDGELLTATAAADGTISGNGITGTVDVETGVIDLQFADYVLDADLTDMEKAQAWYDPNDVDGSGYIWMPRSVWPTTARYNCVAYVYLPLSSDILGINPVRLPMDGRVPLYRVGDVVVIHHTQETSIASPTNGQVVDLGRVRIAWAILYDANGDAVDTAKYTVDLEAGTVTLDDITGYATPLLIKDRMEDMALVNDLQIDGTLGLTKALSHTYPADETYVSSALITSDLFARVTNIFEQETWLDHWQDTLEGTAPLAAFNNTAYPITITNEGGTQERWMAKFVSSTTFDVYGEFSGKVATGNTSTDCSPLNPATNEPYFTIPALGWGSGWEIGNVLRFNTVAANKPVWIARTVLQSDAYSGTDEFCIEVRGDVDTP